MNVGICGLGLIGGSMARAYAIGGHRVYGYDADENILSFATVAGAVYAPLNEETLPGCDLILIAVYPEAAKEYLENAAPYISKNTVVIDCCGTKQVICSAGFALAEKYGFVYAGGHPMAGTHHSGFAASRSDLFEGAPMVIVPPVYDDPELLHNIKALLAPLGFGSISVTTAEDHDKMIAFTSQLAHIVSSAYIKSPTAKDHKGFSAGSYKDMTRVAHLNPHMWTELFLENRDFLVYEINNIVSELQNYSKAIADGDKALLHTLLAEGSRLKEEIDGK